MPTDMFLKLEGVEGETEDSKHSNEIEVLTFSFSATQQGTFASGGGGGAGKVAFGDLHIHKRVDKASANLFKKCATGDHIKSAVLTVRKAGKEQQEYYKIKLTDLLVSSVVNNGSEHHGSVVTEDVTLNFTKVEFDYKPQKADGTLGGSVKFGYDLKKMEEV